MGNSKLTRVTEIVAMVWCGITALGLAGAVLLDTKPQGVPVVAATVLGSLLLCILHAAGSKGWQKALAFSAISFVISWVVEFVGCNYGWWFGDYGYTPVLGWAIGNVPILVVVSWETVIYPSHLLVDELAGDSRPATKAAQWVAMIATALATALVTTTWDTMTDPLAVHQNFWTWDHGGDYLKELAGGIPFGNYWGWIGAVFIISLLYRVMYRGAPADTAARPSCTFATFQFTSLFLGAATALIQHGLPVPAFIGAFTMGPLVVLIWTRWIAQQMAASRKSDTSPE